VHVHVHVHQRDGTGRDGTGHTRAHIITHRNIDALFITIRLLQ
jgi:hypothetical protein